MPRPDRDATMPYEQLFAEHGATVDGWETFISEQLVPLWLDAYNSTTPWDTQVMEVPQGRLTYLFDMAPSMGDVGDDRVVAVWGRSTAAPAPRDRSRQAGFIPIPEKWSKAGYDRGHFVAHAAGGGMDMNFFPQAKGLNRGHHRARQGITRAGADDDRSARHTAPGPTDLQRRELDPRDHRLLRGHRRSPTCRALPQPGRSRQAVDPLLDRQVRDHEAEQRLVPLGHRVVGDQREPTRGELLERGAVDPDGGMRQTPDEEVRRRSVGGDVGEQERNHPALDLGSQKRIAKRAAIGGQPHR